jgi:hypothetical protein
LLGSGRELKCGKLGSGFPPPAFPLAGQGRLGTFRGNVQGRHSEEIHRTLGTYLSLGGRGNIREHSGATLRDSIEAEHSLLIHSPFTPHTLPFHSPYTPQSLPNHSPCSQHPFNIHSTSTQHPFNIHSTSTQHPLNIHSTSTQHLVKLHSTSTQHPLNV